jgi:pimeloyl-ACP methyl ester carboxylesterase
VGLPGVETGRIAGHPFVRAGPRGDPDGGRGGREAGGGDGRPLVLIPGLNDPLQRVCDSRWYALAMWGYCRRWADGRPVYVASRPRGLPADADTRSLARGYADVLAALCDRHDADRADAFGISMGGFLVAHLAADRPDLVGRAVLALAADHLADRGRALVDRWLAHARRSRWLPVYLAAAGVVARGWRRRAMRAAVRVHDLLTDPVVPEDFRITARATLAHDAGDRLAGIERPTLVVGGDGDPFFSLERFRATARAIPGGRFARLRGASHEAVIQHPGVFEAPIREFLDG